MCCIQRRYYVELQDSEHGSAPAHVILNEERCGLDAIIIIFFFHIYMACCIGIYLFIAH